MFEYIEFGVYAKCDKQLNEIHNYLIEKIKHGEYITSDDTDYIQWYGIYCELTNKWYTSSNVHNLGEDENDEDIIVIDDAIITDDKPDFFGDYFIRYDDKLKKSMMILNEMPTQYDEEDFTIDGKLEHGKYFCWYRDNNEYHRLHIASNDLDFQWPHDSWFYFDGNIYKEYFYNKEALLAFKVGDKIYMREQYALKFYLMPREPIDDKDAYELYFNNKQ